MQDRPNPLRIVHAAAASESACPRVESRMTRDELRAELAEMKVDLIKWMVGTGLGIAAVTATLAGIILRSLQ